MLITAHLLMKLSRFVHVFGNYHRIFAQTLIILISKEGIAETKVKRTNERKLSSLAIKLAPTILFDLDLVLHHPAASFMAKN